MESLGPELLKLLQIIWINVILSGDNAVVIALACRGLPQDKQKIGMVLGALVAVGLRIVFTVAVATLLSTPFLKIVGGCLLLWISVKLVLGDEEGESKVSESRHLWHAIRTVAIADAVMSLDNVLAIAAVAKDSIPLLIAGLAISVPMVVAGAAVIMALLSRFPIFVWAGAGLLGWVAGAMLVSDPWLVRMLGDATAHVVEYPAAVVGAVFVLGLGYVLKRRAEAMRALRQVEQEA